MMESASDSVRSFGTTAQPWASRSAWIFAQSMLSIRASIAVVPTPCWLAGILLVASVFVLCGLVAIGRLLPCLFGPEDRIFCRYRHSAPCFQISPLIAIGDRAARARFQDSEAAVPENGGFLLKRRRVFQAGSGQ